MPDLFLSYSRDDRVFMHTLLANLRKVGFNVWIDEEHLTVGTPEWQTAIEEAVKRVDALVVILTPSSKASKWVNIELTLAEMFGTRIFPVLAAGEKQTAVPLPLLLAQYADMRGRSDYESGFRDLIKGLAAHTELTIGEFSMDFSGEPRVQISVYGSHEGAIVAIGGDNLGDIHIASEPSTPSLHPYEPEMLLIPAGPFLMGSPKSDSLRFDDEPEQFELDLPYDYAIGKYPVTVEQYRYFLNADGYATPSYWTEAGWKQKESEAWTQPRYWGESPWTDSDDLPVVGVSWYEAYAYAQWLAEATGREYRLLTEAEWEKATRGGLHIPDGKGGMKKNPKPSRIWPWGDEEPTQELCNFNNNYMGGRTSPVTSHAAQAQAQPYGLYHMAGNVWEWCLSTWANPYTHPEQNDPQGDSPRLVRGGSWYDYVRDVRCSLRSCFGPHYGGNSFGFRVGGVVPVLP